jgi:chemotaxis protein CheD
MSEDVMVRMGELAVSSGPGDVLTSIGLGSCIGLALVDAERQTAGLAHVMLPARPTGDAGTSVGKFADTAVPALLDAVLAAGARRARLSTYLVGGAQMFRFGGGMDVGARNDTAVRDALGELGLRVRAAETGVGKCLTVRVFAADGRVSVKQAGGAEHDLVAAARPAGRERPIVGAGTAERRGAATGRAPASARRASPHPSPSPSREHPQMTTPLRGV